MDGRTRWRRAAIVALLVMMTMSVGIAAGQQGGQSRGEGAAAFAGGQMVRGTVTAAAADHLIVRTDLGEVYQVSISANTRVMKDRQPVKLTDVKTGDGVGAMGVLDAPTKNVHALFVSVIDAEQVRKMKESLGKAYITGKVTAIDDLKLTVMRPDGVSQVIEVDEGTSFKRGGRGMVAMLNGSGPVGSDARPSGSGIGSGKGSGAESITLADVKVGDTVVGPGALKNGVFVPTELGVMDSAMMGQRRRHAPEGAPGAIAPPGTVDSANPTAIPK